MSRCEWHPYRCINHGHEYHPGTQTRAVCRSCWASYQARARFDFVTFFVLACELLIVLASLYFLVNQ